jgi:sulfur carrier protein ThiS
VKILFINNFGGGFADHVEVESGITIAQLFEKRMPGRKAEDYLIRVNRQPAPQDEVLRDGDRVSITPLKIEGAALADG